MKVFLATWLLEPAQGDGLTNVGARNRLVSYYHTKAKSADLQKYIKTGRNENIHSIKRPRK